MMTPVDHLIGSHLGIGTFVRYCDDVVVYAKSRELLSDVWKRVEERCCSLRLKLHPKKCRLHRTSQPVAFVGFVLQRHGTAVRVKLKADNVRRFRARMKATLAELRAGGLSAEQVASRIRAWLAHASHGHTKALCKSVLRDLAIT